MQDKRYSFNRNQRLIKPAEYQTVFEQQKKLYCQGLVVYYCENQGPNTRLGLAVAKRHFKKAVDRNRIKRIVRESFRMQKQELGNKDIIVVATSKLREHKPCQITSALNEIWKKLAVRSSSTP